MLDFIKRKKKIVIPVAVALVLLVLFLVFRPRSGDPAAQFQTAPVERGDLTATVGATGTVRARQSATLAWQTSGTVEEVNVQVGDTVKAGDVLASLSKTSLPQTIILAEAELVSAQRDLDDLKESDTARAQAWIALRNAREAFEKAYDYREALNYPVERTEVHMVTEVVNGVPVQVPKTKSYKSKATPKEIEKADADLALKQAQYEDAKRAYERVENGPNADDLDAAQARVDAAQATLNLAHLTAPFAGTVTEALPLPGDQVSTGALAFRVDDLRSLLVDVELSEVDINSVTVGQTVSLTFDAILGKEYQGKVTKVAQAGTVVSGVVNFTVTVELTDPDELVKPGMTAAVNIVVKEIKDAVLVPNRAVRLVDGDRVVFVMGEDGKPQKVEIRLGASSDTMSVVVGGDLKEGDLILLNPTADLTGSGPPFAR
ncbi:MAG: efflux RND transporter periplasmic adaptor subunit [Chloroflexota bacterium]